MVLKNFLWGVLPDVAEIKQSKLGEVFVRLLKESGIEFPTNLLGKAILYVRSLDKKSGAFMAVDKDTAHMKKVLSELSPDMEARLSQDSSADIAIQNIVLKDPETVKYVTWFEEIEDYSKGLIPAADILTKF